MIRTLRRQAPSWRPTAVAEVAAEQPDPFRVLVACLLSLRTQDATTREASERLFRVADTPEAMLRLPAARIARLIFPVGFYRTKARVDPRRSAGTSSSASAAGCPTISTRSSPSRASAGRPRTSWSPSGSTSPASASTSTSTASRIAWGSCGRKAPDQTELALRAKLPRRYWIGYNDLLVAFGQNVCRPLSPHCSRCPVARSVSAGGCRSGPLSARTRVDEVSGARVVRAVLLGLLPLALAAGLWRVERDRPLWLTPGASPVPHAAPGPPPTLPRLVLAVHYPWYGTPGGPDGPLATLEPRASRDARGRGSSASTIPVARPDPGGSTSARPTTPRAGRTTARTPPGSATQMALAREAGLDGFLVSWWGRESEEALGLAALFRDAGEAGLVLAPVLRDGRALAPGRRGRGGGPGEPPGPSRARARLAPRRRRARGVPLRVAPAAAAGVGRGARPARRGGPAALPGRRRAEPGVAGRAAGLAPALRRPPRVHAGRVPGAGPGRGRRVPGARRPRARGRAAVHPRRRARVRRPPGANAGHRRGPRRRRDLRRSWRGGPRRSIRRGSSSPAGTSGTRAARSSRASSTGAGTSTRRARGPSASGGARPEARPAPPGHRTPDRARRSGSGIRARARTASSAGRRDRATRDRATRRRSGARAGTGRATAGGGAPRRE